MRKLLLGAAFALGTALSAGAVATPASAALVATSLSCSNSDISPTATACSGWWNADADPTKNPPPVGNLLNDKWIAEQQAALSLIGFTWDGDWSVVDLTKVDASDVDGDGNKDEFDFLTDLGGISYIGIHKGKGGGTGVEGTAFFKITADDLDYVKLNLKGASGAVVYGTCVGDSCDGGGGGGGGGPIPEPGTWALMIMGFGGAGAMLRRRRTALA